jgi:hypothetical protein
LVAAITGVLLAPVFPVLASESPVRLIEAAKTAAAIAGELERACPHAAPGDQRAFESCRQTLYRDSTFKRSLADYVLWGRQRDPKMRLADTPLTQFAPDVLSAMYVPLFMFSGRHEVDYVESEGLYRIRLQAGFRNRLQPGQYPYPFWHEPQKWSMYEGAKELILWWDAGKGRVKAAQFTVFGDGAPLQVNEHVTPPTFGGEWRWTDANGKSQPAVTVFDGLLRTGNPYAGQLDMAYKRLALRLRDSQCLQCHVPNNPDGTKRLVLLQTPLHAAGEIPRLLRSVREGRMPRDEFGVEVALDEQTKQALLADGVEFEALLNAARKWDRAATAEAGSPPDQATPPR